MITVIVASANKDLLQQLKENIRATIGVPYEVLGFDNSSGEKGICRIYNEGITKATYDLLCFMHEDVVLHTKNWGSVVLAIFKEDKNLGVLGIAGSTYKSLSPSGWLSYSSVETEYSNLIQSFKYTDQPTLRHLKNKDNQKLAKVAAADGVWLCVPKTIATQIPFDENTFTRFHCYDIDFCLAVGKHYTIAVTFDVLLHHFSEGNFDATWIREVVKLHEKWSDQLPVYTGTFTAKQIYQIERQSFKYFIKKLVALQLPARTAYQVLHHNNRFFNLNARLYFKLHYYIIRYFFLNRKAR